MTTKKPEYRDYLADYKSLLETGVQDFPRLLIVTGTSDYLRLRTIKGVESHAQALCADLEVFNHDFSDVEMSDFILACQQKTMFAEMSLTIFKRCQKSAILAAWLKTLLKGQKEQGKAQGKLRLAAHVVIELEGAITAELRKQLNDIQSTVISADEPVATQEFEAFAAEVAKNLNVTLSSQGVRWLVDVIGTSFGRIESELQKISLTFPNEPTPLSVAQLSRVVGSLKEEHVFELFSLLRAKKYLQADIFIQKLLDQGEKSIAVLGIISKHARDMILRNDKNGLILLRKCSQIDLKLKSSPISDGVLLSQLVHTLMV